MNDEENTTAVQPRAEDGKFAPGGPGGPGRPKGMSHSEKVRMLLEPHREQLIGKAVEVALTGDPHALRLCLERLAPTPRPEAEKVIVPGLKEAPTLRDKATAILAAVATGDVSAEAGQKLLQMLDVYGRAVSLDTIERRLEAIERGTSPRVVASTSIDTCEDLL